MNDGTKSMERSVAAAVYREKRAIDSRIENDNQTAKK